MTIQNFFYTKIQKKESPNTELSFNQSLYLFKYQIVIYFVDTERFDMLHGQHNNR